MERGRAGAWVLAALAPVVVLALDPAGWYPFGPAKWLAVSVLVPLGLALVLRAGPARFDRRLGLAVLVLLALLVAAAAVGADPRYAWLGTPERQFGVLTWVLCALALLAGQSLDDGHRRLLGTGAALAALGVGLVASAEALGWRPGPVGLGGDRLTGTFGSAAYLGAAGALLLPAALGTALDPGSRRPVRAAAAVGALAVAVAVVGAGARAAWVGLVAAGALAAWSRRRWLAEHARVAVVAGAIGLGGLGALAVLSPVADRIGSAFDADAPGGRGRVDEWRVAARVVARHPLVGVGPEGYRSTFAEGADAAYERAHGRDPLPDRAHSGLLDVALAGGVGAAAAWLVVLGLVGRSLVRAARTGPPWLVGVAIGLVAHWVGQLLLFPTVELEPVAWLLAGAVVAATARPGETGERDLGPTIPTAVGLAAAVALVAGSVGVAADRRAEHAASALARGDGVSAARWSAGAVDLRPDVLRYHLLDARARVAAGEGTVAGLAAVDDALAISPADPVAELARARLLVDRARATSVPAHARTARRYLAQLVADDPVDGALRLLQGEAARVDGDAAAAAHAWRAAERLAPRDPVPATDLALLYLATDRRPEARAAIGRALRIAPHDERALAARARIAGSG